jgi:glyoxylase-like metal-dependent hydrolase (beta-lactamase superfamily II)
MLEFRIMLISLEMKLLNHIAFVLTILVALFSAAFASAPQLKTQAPGYYRLMVGDYEVTVLLDGFFPMKPKEVLTDLPEKKLHEFLSQSHQEETIPTSVNAFLVNTGTRLILIDAGCGAFFGPSFGRILGNLKASGYTPEQVDEVEITHMHTDHLGGIVLDGKAAFPHATIRLDQQDADYWLNIENAKTAKAQMKDMFANAVAAVAPYKALGQFKPFHGKTELAPGITAIPSYGHTPGHTAYAIESQGKKLLLVGDLFHIEAIQFPDPSVSLLYDSDSKEAAVQRKKIFQEASEQGFLLGAAHLPFPGIGHVSKVKSVYRYLPIPYAAVQ